ncbi:MAG TPA: hypothetical protein VG944_02300 [Fimbriimonas sp.]|nr:hypothetical protein [Fimbriimonas sp.]
MQPFSVRLERQSEVGAPFENWTDASVVVGQSLPDEYQLRVCAPESRQPISAYRLVFELPFEPEDDPLIHHASVPRMKKAGSVRIKDDFGEGLRSDLTASYHFDERPGQQSFGLFPPLVVLGEQSNGWILGPTSEQKARCSFGWSLNNQGRVVVDVQFDFWATQRLHYVWPDNYEGETFFVQRLPVGKTLGPCLFDGYHRSLQGGGRAGAGPNAKSELFWGSWNDGALRNIDSCRIVGAARWLRENVPNVKWIQIDDGWAGPSDAVAGTVENGCESLEMSDLGVFYRPEFLQGDPRFPGGMGRLAREIKELGLKPMIWLTPTVTQTSPLFLEHPGLFQDYARLHFVPQMRFFDFSVPEARDYVRKCFDTIFGEWGFEGCKLDFWSMGFEQRDIRSRHGKQTAVEWMTWFMETLRSYVGEDGLLIYGIDLPFGSPFRGRFFDQYRYYADSEGSCQDPDSMREQAMWAAYLTGLYQTQRYWVPDGDGLGLFDHFHMPVRHYRRWGAFLLGSGTLTELAGWLHQKAPSERLGFLKRFASHARLGSRVELPGYDFLGAVDRAPSVWIRHDGPDEKVLALTNWTDSKERHRITVEMLGCGRKVNLRNILTDQLISLPAEIDVPHGDGAAFVTET